jgi:hypothetical protein
MEKSSKNLKVVDFREITKDPKKQIVKGPVEQLKTEPRKVESQKEIKNVSTIKAATKIKKLFSQKSGKIQ